LKHRAPARTTTGPEQLTPWPRYANDGDAKLQGTTLILALASRGAHGCLKWGAIGWGPSVGDPSSPSRPPAIRSELGNDRIEQAAEALEERAAGAGSEDREPARLPGLVHALVVHPGSLHVNPTGGGGDGTRLGMAFAHHDPPARRAFSGWPIHRFRSHLGSAPSSGRRTDPPGITY
jgi:hypothetical protein